MMSHMDDHCPISCFVMLSTHHGSNIL
jgi:hypothetical protein